MSRVAKYLGYAVSGIFYITRDRVLPNLRTIVTTQSIYQNWCINNRLCSFKIFRIPRIRWSVVLTFQWRARQYIVLHLKQDKRPNNAHLQTSS